MKLSSIVLVIQFALNIPKLFLRFSFTIILNLHAMLNCPNPASPVSKNKTTPPYPLEPAHFSYCEPALVKGKIPVVGKEGE